MKKLLFTFIGIFALTQVFAQLFISDHKIAIADGVGPVIKIYNYPEGTLSEVVRMQETPYYIRFNSEKNKIYAMGGQYVMSVDLSTKETQSLKVHEGNPKIMFTPYGLNSEGIALYGMYDLEAKMRNAGSGGTGLSSFGSAQQSNSKTMEADNGEQLLFYDCERVIHQKSVPFKYHYVIVEEDGYIADFDFAIQKRSYLNDEIMQEYYSVPEAQKNFMKTVNMTSQLFTIGRYIAIGLTTNATDWEMNYIEKSSGKVTATEKFSSLPNSFRGVFYMENDMPFVGIPKSKLGPMPSGSETQKYQKWIQDSMDPDYSYIEVYADIAQRELLTTLDNTNGMTFISDHLAMVVRKNTFDLIDLKTWKIVCSIDRF